MRGAPLRCTSSFNHLHLYGLSGALRGVSHVHGAGNSAFVKHSAMYFTHSISNYGGDKLMKIRRHLQTVGYVICALSLLGGIIAVQNSQGATYYVALNGDDSNPGTEAQPFKDIGKGVSVLTPGDTLYVREGTYRESFIDIIPGGTSWDAPVTVAVFPGETVTIRPDPGAPQVLYF